MQEKESLKTKLIFSSERLNELADQLPEELAKISTLDSSGKDEQDLFKVIKSLSSKFEQFSKELESPFKIAVVGSQGTGKSTLINLLLGEALMPSTTLENESAVIRLVYPTDENLEGQAVFELMDNSKVTKTIAEANLIIDKKTREEKGEDSSFVKKIKYVTYYIKNEQLRKIELVNTPGMNVLTDDFYPKVNHLFTEADIILWVNNGEQILDNYNSWLIKKIHADNDKIVGFITFPDKLYQQDEIKGVTDVVTQFMEKLEDGKLIRVNDQVGLFVFNGLFAQISKSHKTNLKFIYDINDLEEDEEKLRMLFNFLHHGFAYSNDTDNINILIQYNLYGLEEGFTQINNEFDLKSFFNYCLDQDYCQYNDDKSTALYTDKGRKLLGEASQFYSFGRFSEEYLIPMSSKSKYELVKSRLDRTLSESDSNDTGISRLIQFKEKLEFKKNKLDLNEQDKIKEFEDFKNTLKKEYSGWHSQQINYHTNSYADELTSIILFKIENDINAKDFIKEMWNSMTPAIFNTAESPVSVKISKIITEAIEKLLPEKIEEFSNESINQIELILLRMQRNYLNEKNQVNINKKQVNIKVTPNIDVSKILKNITKLLKPLLKKVLIEIAKKDLRKGANTFLKKNIIKPLVILIRKALTKFGVKFLKKKVAGAAVKGSTGFGWILVLYDVATISNDFHNMYKEMKIAIGDQLKEDTSFKKGFEEEALRVLNAIMDEVINDLNESFSEDSEDTSFILKGIAVSENVLNEIEIIKTMVQEVAPDNIIRN